MVRHIKWTEIESFYHVRKHVAAYPILTCGNDVVTYRAKVKLHGSCGCVAVSSDGTVTAMSRSVVLVNGSDNAGFAKWVADRSAQFAKLAPQKGTLAVFGEWVGPGVQKGAAVTEIKERSFVVFAARVLDELDNDVDFLVEPFVLTGLVQYIDGCHVLPWFNSAEEFNVDWVSSPEGLQPVIDRINTHVDQVEACDPWVLDVFNVKGTGEGLVFYPTSQAHRGYRSFSNLCFKAKGEKHKVVSKTKPAQADPTVAASSAAFAEMVMTPARLEQGVRAVNDGDLVFNPKNIGQFLAWISKDIIKETKAEMDAAGLDQKVAVQACSTRARAWYLEEMKKL